MTTDLIPAWEDGVLRPMDKMEVHRRGLRHKAVSVFVMAGRQVLIQRRAAAKYHTPGLWANTCCTHPHWQEAPIDCAHRRLQQELGISDLMLQPVGQVSYRADVGGGLTEDEEVDVFIAHSSTDLPLSLNPDEVQASRWVDLDLLLHETRDNPAAYTPWLRIYLSEYRGQIFGSNATSHP